MPILDPKLPICPPQPPSPGFRTAEEMEAAVDDDAEAVCQADFRRAVYRVGSPPRAPARSLARSGPRRLAHANAYHYAGPYGINYVRHGVRSGIEVKNPTVDHRSGAPYEHVLGRSLAQGSGGSWVEAGWGEFSYYSDRPVAFSCANASCADYLNDYTLSVGTIYAFRAYHCGSPGELLTCGEIWYGGGWQRLGTWTYVRCTNSDGSGNCRAENLAEVYSEDSTPHPSFGGGGMAWQNGMLKVSSGTWDTWTTAYGTPGVAQDSPYVVSWAAQWYQFTACQGTC